MRVGVIRSSRLGNNWTAAHHLGLTDENQGIAALQSADKYAATAIARRNNMAAALAASEQRLRDAIASGDITDFVDTTPDPPNWQI